MAQKTQPKKSSRRLLSAGSRQEREQMLENLALLMSSGMSAQTALQSAQEEVRSKSLKKVVKSIQDDVDAGQNFWRAMNNSNLFSAYAITFIRIGEESGRLSENLKVIIAQQEKDRMFRSKLRSAMIYPGIVMGLCVVVGGGIAWFILPRLATLFKDLKVALPPPTKALIAASSFMHENGLAVLIGLVVALIMLVILVILKPSVREIPLSLARHAPILGRLIQQIELARFGFIAGTLLEAGLPIVNIFKALSSATQLKVYRRLYERMAQSIEDGESFKGIFADRKIDKLIPRHMQTMVIAGEQSGKLAPTFVILGKAYEEKIDVTSKNLATLLEPIMLIIVWLMVVAIALAVILPIYRLIGGLQ